MLYGTDTPRNLPGLTLRLLQLRGGHLGGLAVEDDFGLFEVAAGVWGCGGWG